MEKLKEYSWATFFNYLAYSLFYCLIIQVIYHQFLYKTKLQGYWLGIPLILYVLSLYIEKVMARRELSTSFFGAVCLIALILSFLCLKLEALRIWTFQHFDIVSFIIIAIFLLNLIVGKGIRQDDNPGEAEKTEKELFNLFYINTSKVHEIAMLIDNKIMKTVEKEQVSEELLKYNNRISVGSTDNWNANLGYSKDEGTKKRVYENFDVKITKSIMLQKVYDNIKKRKSSNKEIELGDLVIFEEIELQQRNIEDTVMILNVLQDSEIKSDPNEELEVNLNKMMDRMLDDFTIDYTFTHGDQGDGKNYLLQLPYKDTDSFENGYQHNDLQLGKLSLIGIYRGEIDFSKKDSTSSKFLELMSESYQNEYQQNISPTMKKSDSIIEQPNIPLKFSHQKLSDELHLIDVIAIIQDLNIDRGE